MSDLHDEIADLESQIQELSDAAERCTRMMLLTKVAIAAGFLLLSLTMVGLLRFGPLVLVPSIGAVLGGVALFGSTRSTRDQIIATIRLRDHERVEMIERLELQAVAGEGER